MQFKGSCQKHPERGGPNTSTSNVETRPEINKRKQSRNEKDVTVGGILFNQVWLGFPHVWSGGWLQLEHLPMSSLLSLQSHKAMVQALENILI